MTQTYFMRRIYQCSWPQFHGTEELIRFQSVGSLATRYLQAKYSSTDFRSYWFVSSRCYLMIVADSCTGTCDCIPVRWTCHLCCFKVSSPLRDWYESLTDQTLCRSANPAEAAIAKSHMLVTAVICCVAAVDIVIAFVTCVMLYQSKNGFSG